MWYSEIPHFLKLIKILISNLPEKSQALFFFSSFLFFFREGDLIF